MIIDTLLGISETVINIESHIKAVLPLVTYTIKPYQ